MLKTFSLGGVHPAENKLSAAKATEILPVPAEVVIPISQHIGAPGTPVVKKGDEVKVGQVIAQSSGFVSANIHSPVSGKVFKIDDILDASGYKRQAIIIKTEGDEWMADIDRSDSIRKGITLSAEEIVKRIGEAGIVGLGGATFPAHVKLSPPPGKTCEVLIINGVECEPYLTSDHRLMLEKGEEMLVGVSLLMKALSVDRAIIGIENNKKDAIEHIRRLVSGYNGISVQPLKVQYPQGGEKQLIDACIGRQVPSGKLPIEVGAVVHNVGTAYAVYEAVQKSKPLIERIVTVTGLSVKNPGNFLVRIGTPISALIEAAGGLPEDTGKVIAGGPMMGKALASLDVPVTKGTSGVLIVPEKIAGRGKTEYCIRCSKCVSACPMGLSPYLLMTLAEKEIHDRAEEEKIMDCIECGSCSFTCPSNRPLLDYIRLGKGKVGQIMRSRIK
ncbi:electron transport complex subunit RsxC [Alkalitalea saponilacus]|uniref:Ion-translocating oxidoreductase complex subunit C n=1 Tax=Alkalitalea saponilacus TaxID=889453 RepID=A0A1T5HLM0_9BACT|nr:electron transport complex subunit RsxC [Alkalitalea saponilacus]ASB47830.1 electron transport complex subunit RsxC [Alkalitalea saponilacus]SKC21552.1 electron transport complex protein RnfC [Alkalitalea saponilacus]